MTNHAKCGLFVALEMKNSPFYFFFPKPDWFFFPFYYISLSVGVISLWSQPKKMTFLAVKVQILCNSVSKAKPISHTACVLYSTTIWKHICFHPTCSYMKEFDTESTGFLFIWSASSRSAWALQHLPKFDGFASSRMQMRQLGCSHILI